MPPTQQKTKLGTRKLSDVAKHLAVPTGITSTGWPAVHKTCREKLGIHFDDWQDAAGRVILAKRDDGNLAAMIDGVGLSLPRQVGKTYLIGAMIFALCVNTPGLLVIWSAHHARTHGETFLAMQGFADRHRVAPHVKQVFTGSGDEEVRFHNGSRILFGARERGFGRGIPGVDALIFDEAQILSDKALSNMLATMNTSHFGLHMYIGTPPKPEDMAESFTRMRDEALAGTLADGAWIEFGADRDSDGEDRNQWMKANPSYPSRTPPQSLLRLKRKLTEGDWLREGMGLWDEFRATDAVIPGGDWSRLTIPDEQVPEGNPSRYALAMSPSGIASIAVAVQRDGVAFLDLAELASVDDSRLMLEWFEKRRSPHMTVMIDSRDPAAAFINELRRRKVRVNETKVSDAGRACTGLLTAIAESRIEHIDQPAMRAGLMAARKKPVGKAGLWEWDMDDPTAEVAAVRAMTLAHFGLSLDKKRTGNGRSTSNRTATVV